MPSERGPSAGGVDRRLIALALACLMGAATLAAASNLGGRFLEWSGDLGLDIGQLALPLLILAAGAIAARVVVMKRKRWPKP